MAGQESKSSRLGSQKVTGTHLVPVRHPVGLVVGYGGDWRLYCTVTVLGRIELVVLLVTLISALLEKIDPQDI